MNGINVPRWLLGGTAAGVLIWVFESVAGGLYMPDMQVAMSDHNLRMDIGPDKVVLSALTCLLTGWALVFFYAASRPRFGAGPRSALIVSFALWLGAWVVTMMGYQMMGLFPVRMLIVWAVVGLVEVMLAGMLGAWIYRER